MRAVVQRVTEAEVTVQGSSTGSIQNGLVVLLADARKGKRPSYSKAARPEAAKELYDYFNTKIEEKGITVGKGIFQAEMLVKIYNDGPVTILLDSKKTF